MINRVILTGRLTSDVQLRKTTDNLSYVLFTLAVNRRTSSSNNQTDFIPCVAWRQVAENMSNYLGKGSLVGVEGRLDVYTNQKDGKYETRITVQVSNITFLESKTQNQNNQNNSSSNNNFAENNNEAPLFNQQNSSEFETRFNDDKFIDDINDEDIDLEDIKF